MKKAFLGICLATFVAVGAFAQEPGPGIADGQKSRHRFNMAEQLNLTDNQKAELKSINNDFHQQMTELKKNEDITVREWKSRMETIKKNRTEKIQHLLTDEQKANLKTIKKAHHHKMNKHGAHRLEKMKKDLALTDDQVAALKKSHEEMAQKMKALRDNQSLTEEQKKAEKKAFRKQQHDNLQSILTPEQLKKLQEHKESHRRKPVQL